MSDLRDDSDHYEYSQWGECDRCGGQVHSREWDGLCYRCAHRPETPAETLRLALTRAKGDGECMVRYLTEPERYDWTPDDLYAIAVKMFRNARLALSVGA